MEQYRVLVNGNEQDHFCAPSYAPGETVILKVPMMRDVDTVVTSADVDLGPARYEDEVMVRTFVMPDHDVDIHIETRNTMSFVQSPFEPAPAMGMMGVMGGMGTLNEASAAGEISKCPVCGYSVAPQLKFCSECGAKLPR